MKKKIITALIIALSAFTLCACGGKESDKPSGHYESSEDDRDDDKDDKKDNDKDDDADDDDDDVNVVTGEIKEDKFPDRPNATLGIGDPFVELSEGDVAPDFTVTLVNGDTFTLSDYDDEVVLLNFWATWCPPCVGEMPALQNLYEDGDAVIIGIDCGETKADVDSFVSENGYTYNIGYDEYYTVEDYYPTDGIPYTLIINKGVIYKIFVGAYGADVMYEEYGSAIAECLE
ncbi:MAG: TlpA family protein disulfide reductase [Lachnospiraceae bacterium]|nr:TlpA family protein disulfide reductase [Lachnospiraceae bacterium]